MGWMVVYIFGNSGWCISRAVLHLSNNDICTSLLFCQGIDKAKAQEINERYFAKYDKSLAARLATEVSQTWSAVLFSI